MATFFTKKTCPTIHTMGEGLDNEGAADFLSNTMVLDEVRTVILPFVIQLSVLNRIKTYNHTALHRYRMMKFLHSNQFSFHYQNDFAR